MNKTLTELYLDNIEELDLNREVFYTKAGDDYITVTGEKLLSKIVRMIAGYKHLGLEKGDRIAILSANRVEWVVTDIAAMFCGIITVPIYTSSSADQIKYILEDSGARMCFITSNLLLDRVLSIKDSLPALEYIVSYDDFDEMERVEGVTYFSEIIRRTGEQDAKKSIIELEEMTQNISSEDMLTIIYTSGTTGSPKGVMLTHKNISSNVLACTKVLKIDEKDVFLSFLPYCHAYERTAGYYLALLSGAKVYYAKNIDTIGIQLPEAKPTIVITVPRLLDKVYNKVMKNGAELKSAFKKKIFFWGVGIARSHRNNKKSFKWKLADKLVFKKIKDKTGGKIRFFVSGGGALNKTIGEFFDGIGVPILEGYGLTETSPVISVNRPNRNKYGTVGFPLENIMVDIAGDGEIMVKGDFVMRGYYNKPEDTDEVMSNGWFHTGDIGEFDEDGFLKITDRKKSLFKTSGGKYIAPAHIEGIVLGLEYIDQVIALGDGKMFVSALIVPEYNELKSIAEKSGIEFNNEKDLIENEQILKMIEKDLKRVQHSLPSHERIRKFKVLENPFTIEGGDMTPTMKIKRKIVVDKYRDLIESMYEKI